MYVRPCGSCVKYRCINRQQIWFGQYFESTITKLLVMPITDNSFQFNAFTLQHITNWLGGVVVRRWFATGDRGFNPSRCTSCRVQLWTSCWHTLSSASEVTTLRSYINQFKLNKLNKTIADSKMKQRMVVIGGGSYWAGRAAAHPLFCSCGPPMCLARPLLGT